MSEKINLADPTIAANITVELLKQDPISQLVQIKLDALAGA